MAPILPLGLATIPARPPMPGEAALSPSGRLKTYGYHNAFRTHSQPSSSTASPPSYDFTTTARPTLNSLPQSPSSPACTDRLPDYHCTVHFKGFLATRCELVSPFLVSMDRRWHSIYAVLDGTQLHTYRLKSSSLFKTRAPTPGRLLRTYSLQHAEVGIAADWQSGDIVPKSGFAKMMPRASQRRLFETDPHLFEPIREFVLRLRIEDEQILLCADTHTNLLDWVEHLCASIDIAQPLDDRNEPKFRTLPRRTRRQRQMEMSALEAWRRGRNDAVSQRMIAQQEVLFQRLYPRLAAASTSAEAVVSRTEEQLGEVEAEVEEESGHDPEAEDLDAADVREDSPELSTPSRPATTQGRASNSPIRHRSPGRSTYDPKSAPARPDVSPHAFLRFRRRCCPVLLASSPRASTIIYCRGQRHHIDVRKYEIRPFELSPPRYDAVMAPRIAFLLSETSSEEADTHTRLDLDRVATSQTYASRSSTWTAEADADAGVENSQEEQEEEERNRPYSAIGTDGTSLHSSRGTAGEYRSREDLASVLSSATDESTHRQQQQQQLHPDQHGSSHTFSIMEKGKAKGKGIQLFAGMRGLKGQETRQVVRVYNDDHDDDDVGDADNVGGHRDGHRVGNDHGINSADNG